MVPVLRNVGTMNYADIEIGVNELGLKVSKQYYYSGAFEQ